MLFDIASHEGQGLYLVRDLTFVDVQARSFGTRYDEKVCAGCQVLELGEQLTLSYRAHQELISKYRQLSRLGLKSVSQPVEDSFVPHYFNVKVSLVHTVDFEGITDDASKRDVFWYAMEQLKNNWSRDHVLLKRSGLLQLQTRLESVLSAYNKPYQVVLGSNAAGL